MKVLLFVFALALGGFALMTHAPDAAAGSAAVDQAIGSSMVELTDLEAFMTEATKTTSNPMSMPETLNGSCLDSGYNCNKDSECCNGTCVSPPGICQ
ncbi:MAG: hypothetical protein ACPGOY_16775 [Rhodospirillaceae bacterium]